MECADGIHEGKKDLLVVEIVETLESHPSNDIINRHPFLIGFDPILLFIHNRVKGHTVINPCEST